MLRKPINLRVQVVAYKQGVRDQTLDQFFLSIFVLPYLCLYRFKNYNPLLRVIEFSTYTFYGFSYFLLGVLVLTILKGFSFRSYIHCKSCQSHGLHQKIKHLVFLHFFSSISNQVPLISKTQILDCMYTQVLCFVSAALIVFIDAQEIV